MINHEHVKFNRHVLVINDISKMIFSFFIWFMRSGTFMHMHAVALMVVIVNVKPELLKKILSKGQTLIRVFVYTKLCNFT